MALVLATASVLAVAPLITPGGSTAINADTTCSAANAVTSPSTWVGQRFGT